MLKLVYCLTRKQDISAAAFSAYWLGEHAPKVAERQKALRATKYVQSHKVLPELNGLMQQSRGLAEPYDGIAEIWWENVEVFREAMESPDGAEAMQQLLDDESTFIDFERSRGFFTEERAIF